jgi:hypothetical protein
VTFPTVVNRSQARTTGNVASHPITLPASIVAGNVLVVSFSVDAAPTITVNTGVSGTNWQKMGQASNGTVVTQAVFWKIAEGSDALTLTTSTSEESSHICHQVDLQGNTGWEPRGVSANGASTNSNPPNLAFESAQDILWIATRGGDAQVVATVAPASFANLQTLAANTSTGASTNTAERSVNASSLDPGTFTSASEQWVSWTIGIGPTPPGPKVAVTEGAWADSSSPHDITVPGCLDGDWLVRISGGDGGLSGGGNSVTASAFSTTAGSTGSWSDVEKQLPAGGGTGWIHIGAAQVTADGDVTVRATRTQSGTARAWGGAILRCRDADGIGIHGFVNTSATEVVNLAGLTQDSAVGFISVDWDTGTPATGYTPAGAVDVERAAEGGNYTVHCAYWLAQASGTRDYGTNGTTSATNLVCAAVEVLAAAGGTAHTVDQTDSAGLTDTSAIEVVKAVAQTDSAGLTDSRVLDQSKLVTDSAGLTDATALLRSAVLTDSAGLTDTSTVQLSKLVAQTDSTGLTDSAVLSQTKGLTDSTGLTDATALARSNVVTDSAGLTDTSLIESGKVVAQTDSAGLTDSQAVSRTTVLTDLAGLTDAALLTRTLVRTDSAGLTDAAAVGILRDVAATDSAGLTDATVLSRTAVLTDLVGLADAAALNQLHVLTLTDSAGLSDAAEAGAGIPQFVPRPDGGTVDRAGSVTTTRPSSGTTPRPPSGPVSRPFAGNTPRP